MEVKWVSQNQTARKSNIHSDQKKSFWQIPPTDEFKDNYVHLNTPFGRYSFSRMSFGISSTSELLQKHNPQIFGGIDNVYASNESEHHATLYKVMARTRENSTKLKKNMIKFNQNWSLLEMSVKMVWILSQNKYKQSETFPPHSQLKTRVTVHRGRVMFNYLAQFIPNMSTISVPLCELLKKNASWVWYQRRVAELDTLKTHMPSPSVTFLLTR